MPKKLTLTRLRIHKHADKSAGRREPGFDVKTGERVLINPDTGKPEPWPLAGVTFDPEPPKATRVPHKMLLAAVAEGWAEWVNGRPVHRPGGPPEEPWRVTHTFVHADAIVFHLMDGDVRYRIAENPDKTPEKKIDDPAYPDGLGFGGTVDWAYTLERDDS